MENNTVNFFDYIGAANAKPSDATPAENVATQQQAEDTSSQQGESDSNSSAPEEVTFKASDLKAIFGDFENVDSIKEKYSMLSEKALKYDEFEPFIKDQETLMQQLESPFADDSLANLNSFMKSTGIKDMEIARKFIGKNEDDLRNSPVQVMALSEVIKDPDMLKTMSFEEVCEAIADEYNCDVDVEGQYAPRTMKMKLGKHLDVVSEKLKNIGENKDFVASLRGKFDEFKQNTEKLVSDWKPIVEQTAKINDLEIEVEGIKVKTAVSQATLDQLNQELMGIISANPSLPDENNVNAIKNYARMRAEALEAKNIYKALVQAVRGESQEKAMKEFHNGAEVVKQERPSGSSEKSQLQRYFESQY